MRSSPSTTGTAVKWFSSNRFSSSSRGVSSRTETAGRTISARRTSGAELVETYRSLGCDLMVMGAYSRGHLRQRILGGVTHEMLTAQNLPVFALHG